MPPKPAATFRNLLVYEIPNPGKKTKAWQVNSKKNEPLGYVRFWTNWRCYTFQPALNTIFEQDCLRDIAAFIEEQTKLLKADQLRRVVKKGAESIAGL